MYKEGDVKRDGKDSSLILGRGNYSAVFRTQFDHQTTVAKAICCYAERVPVNEAVSAEAKRAALKHAASEQRDDVATEIWMLGNPNLADVAEWAWRPHFHACIESEHLSKVEIKRLRDALGFVPCSLLFMEELPMTLDTFIDLHQRRREGVDRIFAVFSDLFRILVGLYRRDIRHNDCMARNIMLRRKKTPAPHSEGGRKMMLETSSDTCLEFGWKPDVEFDVVLIDFGLASIGAANGEKSNDKEGQVVTHAERDDLYAKFEHGESLEAGLHPLEMSAGGLARNLIDLQCFSFNLLKLAANKTAHPRLSRWSKEAHAAIDAAQKEADGQKRRANFEAVVAKVMPPTAHAKVQRLPMKKAVGSARRPRRADRASSHAITS